MLLKLSRAIAAILCSLFVVYKVSAQTGPTVPPAGVTITNAIPASADAAALGKYGNIPVGAYTGVPNISIPLYTIKSGDLSLPVSLSYHSSGNKVEEMASSVGLGWVLNCGGAITRTIRSLADEENFGFLTSPYTVSTIDGLLKNQANLTTAQQAQLDMLLNKVADGSLDGEPDEYNFNFGGYSGRFVMDQTGTNFFIMPLQNIKFTMNIANGQTTYINSFTAKTPDGVTYYFGGANATEFTNSTANKTQHSMSWFLTRIVSPSGHEIDFSYTPEGYSIYQAPSQTMYQWLGDVNGVEPAGGVPQQPNNINSNVTTALNTVKLQSVTFDNGGLSITATSNRYDINPSGPGLNTATAINSIAINSGSFSKVYNLYYTNNSNTRLRLDSLIGQLEPIPGTGNYKEEKYSFTYSPDPWKPASSTFVYQQDWWGYYNGQGNIVNGLPTLVPGVPSYTDPYGGATVTLHGANRSPDQGSMLGGMLTKLTYPTGGYTLFTYEANHESNIDVGGTEGPGISEVTAFSNDPSNYYYNYDINNNNSANTMVVYANSNVAVPINVSAGGLKGANEPPVLEIQASIYNSSGTPVYFITNTDTTIYFPALTISH